MIAVFEGNVNLVCRLATNISHFRFQELAPQISYPSLCRLTCCAAPRQVTGFPLQSLE